MCVYSIDKVCHEILTQFLAIVVINAVYNKVSLNVRKAQQYWHVSLKKTAHQGKALNVPTAL